MTSRVRESESADYGLTDGKYTCACTLMTPSSWKDITQWKFQIHWVVPFDEDGKLVTYSNVTLVILSLVRYM